MRSKSKATKQQIIVRKKSKEILAESEEQYRDLFENAPVGYLLVSKDGHIIKANRCLANMLGYAADELVSRPIISLYANKPTVTAKKIETVELISSGKEVWEDESQMQRKDGSQLWVSTIISPLTDKDGQVVATRATVIDITERKQAEEALVDEATRRRILVDQSRDGIVVLDQSGKVYEANQRFAEMLGYSPEEVRDLYVWDWEFQYPREQVQEMLCSVDEAGDYFETRHRRKDGTIYDVAISTNGVVFGGQKLVFCVCRDITEHKHAIEKIRIFSSAVAGAIDAIAITDMKGIIIYANSSMEETYGYKEGEMLGKSVISLSQSSEIANEIMSAMIKTGSWSGEIEAIKKNKEIFSGLLSLSTVRDEKGNPIAMMGAFRDITKRKQAEERIKTLNRFYVLLSDTNQAIVRVKEREKLFQEVCQIAVNSGKFSMAWIGLIDEESGDVRPVTHYGHEEGFLKILSLNVKAEEFDKLPIVLAMQEGKVTTCDNMETDAGTGHLRDEALKRGYRSLAVIPLKLKGKVICNFSIYSERPEFFSEEDRKLLSEIGDDLSYAMETIETEKEHKVAEQALQDSEAKYRLLAENVTDVIWTRDMNLQLTYISPSVRQLRGYTPEEVMYQPLEKIFAPSSIEAVKRAFKGLLSAIGSKEPKDWPLSRTLELEHLCKDGSTVWVENKVSLMRDQNGNPIGILGISRDITERRQNLEKLQKTVEGAIETIAAMAETRDPYTAGHQRRVSKLASAIAQEMGLSKEQIETIRIAGILHDIGKVSVPSEILSKPTKLNQIEIDLIRGHPAVSRDILKSMKLPWPICPIVLQHHERMDGSGYPNGLSGQDILLEARILAVADVVEAMASHRPYRPARGVDKALEEITQNKGTLYDAEVVAVCLKLFTEKGFKFE